MTSPSTAVVPNAMLAIDLDDLASRLALANPEDTCKGMFFNGVFRAMERGGFEPPSETKRGKKVPLKFVDFFNYPITEFLPMAWRAAQLLGGGEDAASLEAGLRSLGRQATDDFLSTAVGKTLLLLASSEPRRLMTSLASGYKTAVSYGTRALEWSTPTRCRFTMRRDFMPHPYHEGVLLQVMTAVGAQGLQVRGTRVGLLDTDYEVSWEARP
ncbi:MAG: TIGR02265 family protein [Myxococcaceae bacterium]